MNYDICQNSSVHFIECKSYLDAFDLKQKTKNREAPTREREEGKERQRKEKKEGGKETEEAEAEKEDEAYCNKTLAKKITSGNGFAGDFYFLLKTFLHFHFNTECVFLL